MATTDGAPDGRAHRFAATTETVSAGSYALLGFLTILNVLNFVDRQLLASFANFVKPDLNLTDTEFGLLTGLVFIVFYAVMGLFMGALADVLHRPRLIAAGLAVWSALTAASGAARGFVSLAIPRMFIGIGESVLTPTSMSLLADRFPQARMGFAAGFYYMGVPIGVGASLLVAGYLGPAIGWRNSFYLLGAIGLVLALIMVFVPESRRHHVTAAVGRPNLRVIAGTLAKALRDSPALTLTIAGGVTTHFILGAAAFEQLWFVQERSFDRAVIAQQTGYIAVAAGVLGTLAGGLGSDWLLARTGIGRAMFLAVLMALLLPINVAYRLVDPDSAFFWIGVWAAYFQLGAFYGPTFSTVQDLVPPQIRATIVAFYILLLNVVGLGVGITGGGMMIDALRGAGSTQPYTVTLVAFTLISAFAIPLFYLAARRYAADRARLFAAMA